MSNEARSPLMAKAQDSPIAPWLVIAVGNPSRGDDALGPELVERMAIAEGAATDVEFLIDFQLQVEHALDVKDRRAVLFVDAARPGVVAMVESVSSTCKSVLTDRPCGVTVNQLIADECVPPASHALRAGAVLHVARQLDGHVPPAWQLAIEGQSFTLGEGLSETAERHLSQALVLARRWLHARRASLA
jgi:Ni,Fe-hydrogenase maturation factor